MAARVLLACACLALTLVASAAAPAPGPQTRPADGRGAPAGPRGYDTFAVVCSPSLQKRGVPEFLEPALRGVPGVRLVHRGEIGAVARELAASNLLGADAVAGRLKLGRRVRADALLILAEDDAGPDAGHPDAVPNRPAAPSVQLVVADCRSGARLFVSRVAFNPGARPLRPQVLALAEAAAAAVKTVRERYPQGVRRVIGTCPFASGEFVHDYDADQRRFAALLDNALVVRAGAAGVAVLEWQEAQRVARERVVGDVPADGRADPVDDRIVPLMVEGRFKVLRGLPAAERGGAAGTQVEFSVRLVRADGGGAAETVQAIDRTVPLGEVGRFLGEELPAEIFRLAAVENARAVPPALQFRALAARADAFSAVGAYELAAPLREAALLVPPDGLDLRGTRVEGGADAGADAKADAQVDARADAADFFDRAVAQRLALVEEYARLTTHVLPGPGLYAARYQLQKPLHDRAWELGLEHLEYLIRNRLVTRREAVALASRLRPYGDVRVPDGPPRLRQFLGDVFLLALELDGEGAAAARNCVADAATADDMPNAPDATDGAQREDAAQRQDKAAWLDVVFGAGGRRLCWSGGAVMTPDAYATILQAVSLMPDDLYPPEFAVDLFGRLPGRPTPSPCNPANPLDPPPTPDAVAVDRQAVDREYAAFLGQVEQCGKPGFTYAARLARLRHRFRDPACLSDAALTDALGQYTAFEDEYGQLRLGGVPPPPGDPLRFQVRFYRDEVSDAIARRAALRVVPAAPPSRPATLPTAAGVPPVMDSGNRLRLRLLPIRVAPGDRLEALGRALGPARAEGPVNAAADTAADAAVCALDWRWLACGDSLDVLWCRAGVALIDGNGVLRTAAFDPDVARNPKPSVALLTDARWDGRHVWLGTRDDGVWVMDRGGRVVAKVGSDEGLPPVGEQPNRLLIEPLAEGRVFATGSFDEGRAWCAMIDLDVAADGTPTGSAHVNVLHRAMTVPPPKPPGGSPAPAAPTVAPAEYTFRPDWTALYRTAAARPGGPIVLVGRETDTNHPLVLDLSGAAGPGGVWAEPTPLSLKGFGASRGRLVGGDGAFVVYHTGLLYFPLRWRDGRDDDRGDDAAQHAKPTTAPASAPVTRGGSPAGAARHSLLGSPRVLYACLPAPGADRPPSSHLRYLDGPIFAYAGSLYAPGTGGWLKVDPGTFATEWLSYEEPLAGKGVRVLGVSERFGVVARGPGFFRAVVTP